MKFVVALFTGVLLFAVGCQSPGTKAENSVTVTPGTPSSLAKTGLSEKDVIDAYVYLMGRYLVIRQERIDTGEQNIGYNKIKYNPLGQVNALNPNLDVVSFESWIAVDDKNCQVLVIPPIKDRYHTVQIMDEWAQVVENINERTHPEHPDGRFAFCMKGAGETPANAYRIEVPWKKAKIVGRIERKGGDAETVRLQKSFKMVANKNVDVELAQKIPMFTNADLITTEAFEYPMVEAVLTSAPDSMKVAPEMQRKVRVIAAYAARSDENKSQIEDLLRSKALPQFKRYLSDFGDRKGGWSSTATYDRGFAEDYWFRTAANYGGIWWNVSREVAHFVSLKDPEDQPLHGDSSYLIYFSKAALPRDQVNAFWSLTLLSAPDFKVVRNEYQRYKLGSANNLTYGRDGSLTLIVGARPKGDIPLSNWIPGPPGKEFSLNLRMYAPKESVLSGQWFAPPLVKVQGFDLPKTSQRETIRVGGTNESSVSK
ncbi:MAG: DUF1254 domain-containing protein [Bdellovibrio sp.]|nr:DUF1254 domain-containing protein [Bdellovibrio sp.]